ncbi:MAG: hypothetical protein EBT75_05100 [Proteobacteria bacterium]|nr:hypothetical protein [Pseudomonadota bacterium]
MRTLRAWAWLLAFAFSAIVQAEDESAVSTASEEAAKEEMQVGVEKACVSSHVPRTLLTH